MAIWYKPRNDVTGNGWWRINSTKKPIEHWRHDYIDVRFEEFPAGFDPNNDVPALEEM